MTTALMMTGCVMIAAGVFITNQTGTKPNGYLILSVSVPVAEQKNTDVLEIIRAYRKAYIICDTAFLILVSPVLLLYKYFSLQNAYMLVWVLLFLYADHMIRKFYWNRMYALKQQRGWLTGTKHVISIDTEVSRLKHLMPLSKVWLVPSFVISAVPIITAAANKNINIMSFLPLANTFIVFMIYLLFVKSRTIVYSENSEINMALNKTYQLEWSKVWVCFSVIGAVICYAVFIQYMNTDSRRDTWIIVFITALSIWPLSAIKGACSKIRHQRNLLLSVEHSSVNADDDQYWAAGSYNNPNDSRALIEKRIGYGATVNYASRAGKMVKGFLVLCIALCAARILSLIELDFGSAVMQTNDNNVTITSQKYETSFGISDIQHAEILTELPVSKKINGYDSKIRKLGRYSVDGYGVCQLYVRSDTPLYIVIRLPDRIVIFNGADADITENYYKSLL